MRVKKSSKDNHNPLKQRGKRTPDVDKWNKIWKEACDKVNKVNTVGGVK